MGSIEWKADAWTVPLALVELSLLSYKVLLVTGFWSVKWADPPGRFVLMWLLVVKNGQRRILVYWGYWTGEELLYLKPDLELIDDATCCRWGIDCDGLQTLGWRRIICWRNWALNVAAAVRVAKWFQKEAMWLHFVGWFRHKYANKMFSKLWLN